MRDTKKLVLASMFIALLTVMSFVPQLGFIQILPTIGVTTMHVPVIIAAILFGRKFGFIMGTTFGVLSLLVALQRAATPFELFFMNPLISVLPRVLFGLSIYEVYALVKKFVKLDEVGIAISAFISTVLHTFFVLGAIVLVYGDTLRSDLGNLWDWLIGIVISNGIAEAVFAVIIAIILIRPLKRVVD